MTAPDPQAAALVVLEAGVRIVQGDCLEVLPTLEAGSVQLCLSSPPYFSLRSYLPAGHPDKGREIGSEPTPDAFVATMVEVFRGVRRVLSDTGCLVINLGDSYAGSGKGPTGKNGIGDQGRRQGFRQGNPSRWANGVAPSNRDGLGTVEGAKPKDLLMIPFRVAMALQQDGWILRSVIPWLKRNPMPESVTDRPSSAVEYLFMFSKRPRYFWDGEAVRVPHAEPWRSTGKLENRGSKDIAAGVNGGFGLAGLTPREYNPAGRSFRNSDPFFDSWQGLLTDDDGDPLALIVNPAALKESHFASFPAKLVEPFVRAATSERGQCPTCSAPWVRQSTSRIEYTQRIHNHQKYGNDGMFQISAANRHRDGHIPGRKVTETTGWQPSCSCPPADPIPQTVLDPFGGAGTVGLVASRLGRRAVLVELNESYCELARRRIAEDAGTLFGDPVAVTPARQPGLGLFEEAM